MKVLYAEDEKQLSSAVTEILRMQGYDVTPVYDGGAAWDALNRDYFDAVILDVMMPVMEGTEVLRLMRESGDFTPVLMLTAKSTVEDRVRGLTSGADDYLGKPFSMKELTARLESIIRRGTGYRRASLKTANIVLDLGAGELKSDIGSLRLNNFEAEVLAHFIKNPGVLFSAEGVNEIVWGGKESGEKAELYIFYLRNKLRQIHSSVNLIEEEGGYALREA